VTGALFVMLLAKLLGYNARPAWKDRMIALKGCVSQSTVVDY
jgi:hypothetical protein